MCVDEYASFWQCARQLDGRRCDSGQTCLAYGENPVRAAPLFLISSDANLIELWLHQFRQHWLHMAANGALPAFVVFSLAVQYVIMTLDNWAGIMYSLMDTWSAEAWIWFLLFAFVTVFFILNLTLAVVEESFSDERERANDVERRRKEVRLWDFLLASKNLFPPPPPQILTIRVSIRYCLGGIVSIHVIQFRIQAACDWLTHECRKLVGARRV